MKFDAEVKARIPAAWVKAMEEEASREGLKVSDIMRRAIRQMLGRKAAIPRKAK
jgi:NOL1/NOP2/fmu family ribosome biogenesis protein